MCLPKESCQVSDHEVDQQYVNFVKQAIGLAPDIGQCPAKFRVVFNERCFKMDTVVRRQITAILKLETFGKYRASLLWFFFLWTF